MGRLVTSWDSKGHAMHVHRSKHPGEKEETGPKMIMQQYFSLPGQHHKTVLPRHHRVERGKHRKKREHQHTTTSHHQGKNRIIFQNRTRENWTLFSMWNSSARSALPGVYRESTKAPFSATFHGDRAVSRRGQTTYGMMSMGVCVFVCRPWDRCKAGILFLAFCRQHTMIECIKMCTHRTSAGIKGPGQTNDASTNIMSQRSPEQIWSQVRWRSVFHCALYLQVSCVSNNFIKCERKQVIVLVVILEV